MSRTYQFFADDIDLVKSEAVIMGTEHIHLKKVLRLRKGEKILVSDGKGALFHAVISRVGKESTSAFLLYPVRRDPEPSFDITLIQAIPRRRKMEWILQKSTELGVVCIVPVFSEYSVPHIQNERWQRKKERWTQIIKEAAKQSYRGAIPFLTDLMPFDIAISRYRGALNILCTPDGEWSLRRCLSDFSEVRQVTVAIGPEGGFSHSEAAYAVDGGFVSCTLGPRVLRLETAVVKVLAILQYVYGDG